ncbi:polysaccharide deacetylase family protein [Paratissierella segnis]|uniref:Polysaccharide deacetylase family protein n=1 Tax=Paratissierella segnis TaxID=2763679 RepID=A0A926IKX9_9FIRM|nr:polysaccharide deacetylase family protein [Paratissierella segnis]MBC8588780.1 polysaccharide deacetylase family protein [Paratissierella segnis]
MKMLVIKKNTIFIILIALLLLIGLILFLLFGSNAKDVFNEDIFYKGTRDEKIVAFACNVDWGNEYIPDMLQIFKDKDIKISFFPTGRWAKENPDLIKSIDADNHEIGNHGYNHVDYDKLSYDKNKEEILKAHNSIMDITGKSPKYFGPPSGAFNDETVKAAKDLGYKLVLWSIDTIDWREDSTKDVIINRVESKIHNSAIILIHPTQETVKALPEIINFLFQKGYKIGTIGDVIN